MTFLEAAEQILRAAKRPMLAQEITAEALEKGLIQTDGKTPQATMTARLYTAPDDSPIRREFVPGPQRAKRGSVRWIWVGPE
jgi:hypothetical protein